MVVDEGRRRRSGGHLRPLQQGDEEGRVRRDALDPQLPHGARRPAEGRGQVVGGHTADHLRQQRVVAGVQGRAGEGPPVDADAGTAGRLVGRDRAGGRHGRAVGQESLGVDPGLHGDAAGRPDGGLVEAELGEARAAGQSQLDLDEVDPGHLLRDRVLDLDAGVGLDEAEPLGRTLGVEVDQQLDRAHPAVAQGLAEPHRGRRHLLPQLVGQVGRRRDLDQLLAPPLEAALPRVEVDHGARAVAHELDLDVPGPGDEALHVERAVAEGRGRLPRAGRHRRIQVLGPRDRSHPPPTTPGDGLHHHGRTLAERGQEGVRLARRGRALGAREHGEAAAGGQRAGRHLVPQDGQRLRLRPDEDEAGVTAALGERRLLGEEAVAGMDGVAPLLGGDRDELLGVQVGRGAGPPQGHRAVGPAHRERVAVVLGVDGDRLDVELGRGAHDAQRHLPAVGHEQPSDAPHAASLAEPALPRSCPRITHSAVASADMNVRLASGSAGLGPDRVGRVGGQATASSRRLTPRIVRRSRHSGSAASSTWAKRRISVPMAICASARASAAPRQ